MSSEPAAGHRALLIDVDATRRQRFGIILTLGLGLAAAAVSFWGTKDTWTPGDRRLDAQVVQNSVASPDPAWDIELPDGPHRDEFQSSCLICHSARLPLGQPRFRREKWTEIVHKMVAVYGAPMTHEDEAKVVDYLLAARPPAP
jgi:hypothetical protein